MSETLTIADVIEEQRILKGASHLRVTLGPEATPERLREEFARLNLRTDAWSSFDPVEIEQSRVARLKGMIRNIFKISRIKNDAGPEDMKSALREIQSVSDWILDADIEQDTLWMAKQRLKRGQDLPDAVLLLNLDLT